MTREQVVARSMSHLNLRATQEPVGRGGLLAWEVREEPMQDRVFGTDGKPPDFPRAQRGPSDDDCVDPPAPQC
jgi:hypothetical protein